MIWRTCAAIWRDLRIVDDESRQWAYLVERDVDHEFHPLNIGARESIDTASHYHFSPPVAPAVVDRIMLTSVVPYLDRPYQLRAKRGEQEILLGRGRLTRAAMGRAPASGNGDAITIEFSPGPVDSLELIIEDGDDAPLVLSEVVGRFPVSDVYFAAPAGTYYLLVGHPEATAPRYELARVRDLVLAVPSAAAGTAPLTENEAFSPATRLTSGSGVQQTLLWIALGLAVVFLTGLTLRLARKEQVSAD